MAWSIMRLKVKEQNGRRESEGKKGEGLKKGNSDPAYNLLVRGESKL